MCVCVCGCVYCEMCVYVLVCVCEYCEMCVYVFVCVYCVHMAH
jgi:hypothetical protein